MKKTPEILAPISDWETCRAAVHSGADAVYVGVPGFNARGRAPSLGTDTLKEIIDFCHVRGVRVLLAFNVLIFEEELEQVQALVRHLVPLGPDAIIVQDIGLARLLKAIAPMQVIHASTQMTVTSHQAVELTGDLGFKRYVLGREVSLDEMQTIRRNTEKELEVFVHGALCVSYSGQCLTSERIGGRSANRGQCAQSCRWPYDLIVDGERISLGERRYLVSPKDLCALEDVPQLAAMGIDSFKIEGRLKSPEYVASAVKSYTDKLAKPQESSQSDHLSVVYSRGFFNGWMGGVNHQQLVDGRYPSHHGLEIGEVCGISDDSVTVRSTAGIEPGDGLLFCDFASERKIGGSVYHVARQSDASTLELRFANDFPVRTLTKGMSVFLNSSPRTEKEIRRGYTDRRYERRVPISLTLSGTLGTPMVLTAVDEDGNRVTAQSEAALAAADKAPLTAESAFTELNRLSATAFQLKRFEFEVAGELFIHNKELKKLRTTVCEQLEAIRVRSRASAMNPATFVFEWHRNELAQLRAAPHAVPELNLLVRDIGQLSELSGLPMNTVYLDYEFGKDYRESIDIVRALGFKAGIATTRILKPGESNHLKHIRKLAPDRILVRNLGALFELQNSEIELIGDFSLNVANSLTATYLLSKGLRRLCPSYDLNHEQLIALFESVPGNYFEVTVHQYMPSFHMEHCVFAAFLSSGTSYRDCGRPCEKHSVELRAPDGTMHPLRADAECRNTMFNGIAQSAAKLIPELKRASVAAYRIESLSEPPLTLRKKVEAYAKGIFDESATGDVLSELNVHERYGISEGQLLNIRRYRDKVKPIPDGTSSARRP